MAATKHSKVVAVAHHRHAKALLHHYLAVDDRRAVTQVVTNTPNVVSDPDTFDTVLSHDSRWAVRLLARTASHLSADQCRRVATFRHGRAGWEQLLHRRALPNDVTAHIAANAPGDLVVDILTERRPRNVDVLDVVAGRLWDDPVARDTLTDDALDQLANHTVNRWALRRTRPGLLTGTDAHPALARGDRTGPWVQDGTDTELLDDIDTILASPTPLRTLPRAMELLATDRPHLLEDAGRRIAATIATGTHPDHVVADLWVTTRWAPDRVASHDTDPAWRAAAQLAALADDHHDQLATLINRDAGAIVAVLRHPLGPTVVQRIHRSLMRHTAPDSDAGAALIAQSDTDTLLGIAQALPEAARTRWVAVLAPLDAHVTTPSTSRAGLRALLDHAGDDPVRVGTVMRLVGPERTVGDIVALCATVAGLDLASPAVTGTPT